MSIMHGYLKFNPRRTGFSTAQNMNLGLDCREKGGPLSPRIVPLLVLVREWSLFKEDAFLQTELILLLLQGVQAISGGSDEVRTK